MSDNSNNVHFSGVRFSCSRYLAIKSALASLGPIMARCGPQMNFTPLKWTLLLYSTDETDEVYGYWISWPFLQVPLFISHMYEHNILGSVHRLLVKVAVGPKRSTNRNLKEIITIECTKTVIFQLLRPLDISKLAKRELIQWSIIKWIYFQAEAITLAIIWLEIVTKRYDELRHKISRSSLPLKTDSVDIIFQHRLRLGSLYFLNKKGL